MDGRKANSGESRLAFALALLAVQLLVTVGLCYLMALERFSVAGCSQLCDYEALHVAMNTFYAFALFAFVGSLAALLFLRRRGWWTIVPPVVSIVLVVIAWLITSAWGGTALQL